MSDTPPFAHIVNSIREQEAARSFQATITMWLQARVSGERNTARIARRAGTRKDAIAKAGAYEYAMKFIAEINIRVKP